LLGCLSPKMKALRSFKTLVHTTKHELIPAWGKEGGGGVGRGAGGMHFIVETSGMLLVGRQRIPLQSQTEIKYFM
jgi:hypothetical protein